MSTQTMPSDTGPADQPRRRRPGDRGGCPAAQRHPAARPHPRRHRARPGRCRRVRPGRAHSPDLDPLPSRRGSPGATGARSHPRQHVDQRDRAHRPRLQLFLAPRQYRRGPQQHPPDAGARFRRKGAGAACWPRRWRMPRPPASALADLRKFFASALVSPVLTAHPTEVRRKSTMDREMEVAALLDRRERVQLTPDEAEASDEQLRRAVLTLWQTNLLRRTKLTVLDEVTNGLSFYDYTFLHEVPRLLCALEDRLDGDGEVAAGELASFLRMGSWIGGDRDGNPFVTAEVMRGTLRAAVEPRAAILSRGTACAWCGAVDRRASGRHLRGTARAGRALAGYLAAPQRRTLPACGLRHLCAADRDREQARCRNHPAGRSARPRPMPVSGNSRTTSMCCIAR